MKKSTRFMLVVPLLSIFAVSSLSALADDHKKSGGATSGMKGAGAKGSSGGAAHQKGGQPGSPANVVDGAVNGAVGGAISGAVGGLLGAFGPK